MTDLVQWYAVVKTPDGEIEAPFYYYEPDTNPLEDVPERFEPTVHEEDIPDELWPEGGYGTNDMRELVDELDEDTEYWVFDAHDELGEYFPSVPDVPEYSHPTMFVGIPKDSVVEVYAKD